MIRTRMSFLLLKRTIDSLKACKQARRGSRLTFTLSERLFYKFEHKQVITVYFEGYLVKRRR